MNSSFRKALVIACASVSLACGSTAPDDGISQRVWYDVTTKIQEFSYPIITPGCSSTGCARQTVASPNSSLSGTFVLSGYRPLTSGDGVYGVDASSFTEVDCGTGTSCSNRVNNFQTSAVPVQADTLAGWAFFGGSGTGEYIIFSTGRIAGDSITGTFSWMLNGGTAASGYGGTYVARPHR